MTNLNLDSNIKLKLNGENCAESHKWKENYS